MALLHHKRRPSTNCLLQVILIVDYLRIFQGEHEATQECLYDSRETGPEIDLHLLEALDQLDEHDGSDLQLLQVAGRSLTKTLSVATSAISTAQLVDTTNTSVLNSSLPKSTSLLEETNPPSTLTGLAHVLVNGAATALLQAATEVKDNNAWWFAFGIFVAAVLVGLVLEFMLLEFSRIGMGEVADLPDDISENDQSSLRTRDSSMLVPQKFPDVPDPESMPWQSPALKSVVGLRVSTLQSGKLMAQEAVLAGGGQ